MSVGRFLDSWVVERTLFEFVNTGGCACCGFQHGGMTAQDFQQMCTDWETDDAKKEAKNPFPQIMQDEIWAERVRFRKRLKSEFPDLTRKIRGDFRSRFFEFLKKLPKKERRDVFSMPVAELHDRFNNKFQFKASYQVVMCAVIDQVSKYHMTGYTSDGASEAEIFWEECLFSEKGQFMVDDEYHSNSVDFDFAFEMITQLMDQACGPSLLPKRDRETRAKADAAALDAEQVAARMKVGNSQAETMFLSNSSDDDDDFPVKKDHGGELGPTFRSDRRLVRMVVFRYCINKAWRKFQKSLLIAE